MSLKDNEVYAPNYKDGETVILLRHPHGGRFEIPELKVNNKNTEAKMIFGGGKHPPIDAVGINPKVAQQLSGADFDGDAVIVIPNKTGSIKTERPLKALENFDPITAYPPTKGMKVMGMKKSDPLVKNGTYRNGGDKDAEMGKISNLITDMTIKGAPPNEIARAVKHSMVVIDSQKHMLNYEQSAKENDIAGLKVKYQGSARAGASTIISRAKSPEYIEERKDYYKIDKKTGEAIYEPTGKTYVSRTGEIKKKRTIVPKMALTDDADTLVSKPTSAPIENIYASHANSLKAMANEARKEIVFTKNIPYSPSARETYKKEVASLNSKLNIALKNAPLERQAHIVANTKIEAIKQANPDIDQDTLKKVRGATLNNARTLVGANKNPVTISSKEWEAIQAGAITTTNLKAIIDNSDLDRLKELSIPRSFNGMSTGKVSQAKAMFNRGYTQAEVADHLGVSVSTLMKAIDGG